MIAIFPAALVQKQKARNIIAKNRGNSAIILKYIRFV